jgi:hypothetical protein
LTAGPSTGAILAADHALAVERQRLNRERRQRLGNPWHANGPVMAAPGEHAHAVAIAAADEDSTSRADGL